MYSRVLVPLDGSTASESVIPHVQELAGRMDVAEVIVLHVCAVDEDIGPVHRNYVDRIAENIKKGSLEIRKRSGPGAKRPGPEVRGEVIKGGAPDQILDYTEVNSVDLIFMATHGHTGPGRWLMGSVTDKVVRSAKTPVWLVRPGVEAEVVHARWPAAAVIVPLDGSRLAECVFPYLEALVRSKGIDGKNVALLSVYPPPMVRADYPADMPEPWEEHIKRLNAAARVSCERYLLDARSHLEDKGIKPQTTVLLGDPAGEIVNYAGKSPFNLVIMATHGRTGSSRWAYGSVTAKVLYGFPYQLLLVRACEE